MSINKKLITASIAGLLSIGGFALNANAASSISGNASAVIAGALDITETTPLNFGGIVQNAAGGTVVVPANGGAVSYTGSITAADAGATRGVFAVTGDNSATYAVSLPTSFTIDDGIVTDTMTVDTITTDSLSGTNTLDGTGNDDVYVGGTLNVVGTEANNAYSGTFTISVSYN